MAQWHLESELVADSPLGLPVCWSIGITIGKPLAAWQNSIAYEMVKCQGMNQLTQKQWFVSHCWGQNWSQQILEMYLQQHVVALSLSMWHLPEVWVWTAMVLGHWEHTMATGHSWTIWIWHMEGADAVYCCWGFKHKMGWGLMAAHPSIQATHTGGSFGTNLYILFVLFSKWM